MTGATLSADTWGPTLTALIRRRRCGLAAATLFVVMGLVFFFLWYPVVHHFDSWTSPGDLWLTYQVAGRVAHGHLGTIYVRNPDNFLTFPVIVFVLTPLAALTSGLHLFADAAPNHLSYRPTALFFLAPYVLILSTVPLMACDAVADRLGVGVPRRLLLGLGGAVALWGAVVIWGHPEDAMAVGFSLYALLFGIDERWNGAGWLFGIAVALQPLVIVTLPLLLVMARGPRALGLLIRAAVVPVAVLIGPLLANFHLTAKTLVQQPGYPNLDHATPWTGFAPRLFGRGAGLAVAAGPGRLVLLVIAAAVAWWARRWRDRPEMLVWIFAVTLALRPLTESVMASYYLYPALAVGMLAASRSAPWRFALAIGGAVFITVSGQWHLGWVAWWILNLAGMVVVVAAGVHPEPAAAPAPVRVPVRVAAGSARPPRPKVDAKLQSTRGRGAARRKQTKKQQGRRR
jgi:hypothetical protein